VYAMLEFRMEHQSKMKLFQEERDIGTPSVQDVITKMENTIIHMIEDKITRAIEKNEIKPYNTTLKSFILLKLYIALIFDWEKNHEPLSQEEIANLFDLYLIKGLAVN